MSDLLTYDEMVKEYRIPLGTLYSMVSRRQIPHVRIGPRFVRFRRSDIEAWLAEHTVQPATKATEQKPQQRKLLGRPRGDDHPMAILTGDIVLRAREMWRGGETSAAKIARALGLESKREKQALRAALLGFTWRHLPM